MSDTELVSVRTLTPDELSTMTDLEYTFYLIHRKAAQLVRHTYHTEVGLSTWLEQMCDLHAEMTALEIVQVNPHAKPPIKIL